MTEIWKDFKYGCKVSNFGRVIGMKGRILRPGLGSHGYYTVAIKKYSYPIHTLVMLAFHGAPPEGYVVCHNDGDRTNNHLDNLRYDTPKGNSRDTLAHGRRMQGTKYASAKLTDDAVRVIRRMRGKMSQRELAESLNVSPAAVQAVQDGRTWKHVC